MSKKCVVCNKELDDWEIMWDYVAHIECEESQQDSDDYIDITKTFDADKDLIWS